MWSRAPKPSRASSIMRAPAMALRRNWRWNCSSSKPVSTSPTFHSMVAATQALLTGTVDLLLTALPGAQAQVQAGVMRGLAVTTQTRWVNLPDVLTFKEAGFPDVALETEHFLLAPAGTPPQLLERFTQAALAVMAQDDIKNRVVALGYAPIAGGPDAVRERIAKKRAVFQGAYRQCQNSADRVIISSPPASGEAMPSRSFPHFVS